jgi:hypothetical protein
METFSGRLVAFHIISSVHVFLCSLFSLPVVVWCDAHGVGVDTSSTMDGA